MFKLDKYAIRTVSGALLAALMFTTSAAAWTGNSGATYNSKNKIQTDDGQIVIDAADITTLDNALAANNTTRNNFDTTAASLYTNLTGISSGVTSAKSALATNLYNMKIRITKDSNGNVVAKASDSPLNWNNTTASVTSTGVNTFTMKQYIDAMTKSVTAADSERTATATYALPSEEKTLADSKSAWSFTLDESNTSATGLNMAGVSNLYLGKGESITLPSGYYGNNLTISNGVKSGGSVVKIGTYSNNNYYGYATINISSYTNHKKLTPDNILVVPRNISFSTSSGVGGTYSSGFAVSIIGYNASSGELTLLLGTYTNTNEGRTLQAYVSSYDVYVGEF